MQYKIADIKCRIVFLTAAIALLTLASAGCMNTDTTTASGNANAAAAAPEPNPIDLPEPDRYSLTTTVSIEPTGTSPNANIPPLQFTFARLGPDTSLSFRLPDPVGQVIYLEKAPMKYLIFPARSQYVELDPDELGFQLGSLMSPTTTLQRLRARGQYEKLGMDNVDGKPAVKYRFAGTTDTRTSMGTLQADSIVYLDRDTGLPLRTEISANASNGSGARIVTTSQKIDPYPDPALFTVPTDMKKVSSTELKQQVQSFVGAIRVVVESMRQGGGASSPPSSTAAPSTTPPAATPPGRAPMPSANANR